MPQDNQDCPIEVVRLAKRPQFLFVRGGKAERRKCLVVQARQRTGEAPGSHIGAGFTATKKVGNAVVRNRAKRRLREAARLLLPRLDAREPTMFSSRGMPPLTLRGRVCLTIWKAR